MTWCCCAMRCRRGFRTTEVKEPMPPPPLPVATIRTQVLVPLRFGDGFTTTARAFSFDGLVDSQENLAFGLGDRAAPLTSSRSRRVPLVRPHSECLTGDAFGSQRG